METRRTNRSRKPEPWNAVAFGAEVRRLRGARRLTVRAVVAALYGEGSKSISAAWRLEQGFRGTCPPPVMLGRLAAVLGVGEAHLLRAAGYGVECRCGRCGTPAPDRGAAARGRMRREVMGTDDDEEEEEP